MRLRDRTAIITGAAGGIGSAIARAFAREGADLCLADHVTCGGLAAEIEALGRQAIDVPTDVARREAVTALAAACEHRFGRIDLLVTVAGITSFGSAATLEEAEWDRVQAVNLKGVFLSCQAVIPAMRRQGYGRIVTIGSVLGKNGGNARPWLDPGEQKASGGIAYGVAKAGVHALTFYLAKELAPQGITVNCIAPGPIASAMTRNLPPQLTQLIPAGRMGTGEEVADAAVYLCGEAAGFVTGEVLDVNGGLWVD